jgi:glucose/arabinose dehydrogenase
MMKKFFVFMCMAYAFAANAQNTHQVGNTTLTEYDLVTGVQIPWELVWGPDDYIWCTTRKGNVLRIDPATGNYETLLTKTVPYNGGSEPGMLGMCLHPDFLTNPKVYVVYNYNQGANTIRERLSMFDYDGTALVNETILIDAIGGAAIHNGSRIIITPDNKILMTTGDTGDQGASSQNISSLNGKILRINLDGTIPSDNPDPTSYVYSYGHRNGQGLCVGPNGIIYESEHGQNSSDELNIVEPNRNYGWPTVQGACNTAAEQNYCTANNVKEPILEWSPCRAVNGLEYYVHPAIPEWQNCILMAVLGGLGGTYERLSVIHLSADGQTATCNDAQDTYFQVFNQRIRDFCVNPHTGALYMALNGSSYPGSGPNIIKEFRNLNYTNTSVLNHAPAQNIVVYPNPVSNELTLNFSDSFIGSKVEIINFNGQLVNETQVVSSNMKWNAEEWAAGNYFVRCASPKGTITKTFVVSH